MTYLYKKHFKIFSTTNLPLFSIQILRESRKKGLDKLKAYHKEERYWKIMHGSNSVYDLKTISSNLK